MPHALVDGYYPFAQDFRSPLALRQSIASVLDHGCFGYSDPSIECTAAVASKLDETHGFAGAVTQNPETIRWLPGLIPALHHVVRVAQLRQMDAKKNSHVSVASVTPIYYRFLFTGPCEGADVLRIPLLATANGHELEYKLDYETLDTTLGQPTCKVLLWCNPHNPSGRVWSRAELLSVAQLCVKHDVLLLSDEVWSDLVYDPVSTPFTGLGALLEEVPGLRERLIVITSPSKTFNVATLNVAFGAVPCPELRRQFISVGRDKAETPPFGYAAALAAYTDPECAKWRLRLLDYLRANRDHTYDVLCRNVGPQHLKMTKPEATYLTWIDMEGLGVTTELGPFFQRHGVALTPGTPCGAASGVRLNFATTRNTLNVGLERLLRGIDEVCNGS